MLDRFSSKIGLNSLLVLFGMLPVVPQQAAAQTRSAANVPVVMLSDLHFDPFHDPEKVPLLVQAPIEQWVRILGASESATQAVRFSEVQKTCKAKESTDTPYALLHGSLLAARKATPSAAFVTVSGDLLVHDLDCRYRASMGLAPSTTDDQSASADFAEKTTVFVMKQVESTFAHIPVYLALGNNDSRCNHNRMDSHDAYLKASAMTVLDGLREASKAERKAALDTYESAGFYTVLMPAPMTRTRLIVINDVYMMPKYANCEAVERDQKGAEEQIAWLQKQLAESRQQGEHVWLLGHLPPAVNPDSSLGDGEAFCSSGKVTGFQTTDDLALTILDNADVITLGIFGHTHMDELHLLRGAKGAVPIKVVAAVSPVSGSRSSFTVGMVAPGSSTLMDYTVYEASNATGAGTTWSKEYAFDETYHEPNFGGESLIAVIARLQADPAGTGEESRSFQTHFMKGSSGRKLSSSWQGYVCSLDHPTAKSFRACVCGGMHSPAY